MTLRWKGAQLEATLEVPDRNIYVQRLSLGSLPKEWTQEDPTGEAKVPQGERAHDSEIPSAESKRHERLQAKVEADRAEGQNWLDRFGSVCEALEKEPERWKKAELWQSHERALLEGEIEAGRLPPWGAQNLGRAQDLLYRARRRARRKVEGAQKRLAQIQSKELQGLRERSLRAEEISGKALGAARGALPKEASRPRKKPGLWVELVEDALWARVGRSQSENAELYRQARDRDLWFHVRGQSGAHVWIPRGQARLGAKSEVAEELVKMGCQLALLNSKARSSGAADVDYTERRHLRAIKGEPGKLEILRSETRFVRLDEAFEKKVLAK
jgi:hypothetical protein